MKPNKSSPVILALETSTEYCSVALRVEDEVFADREQAGQKHSEMLLPMIDALLHRARVETPRLDAIAFGAGPGSFTGLRIACGVAQGLSFALELPCVPVGSLEAMAEASGGERVLACADARMEQVYLAAYERSDEVWREVLPPALCDPGDMPDLPGSDWLGCGGGFERYPEIMAGPYASKISEVRFDLVPQAREVCHLGARYLSAGKSVASTEVAPLYVRNKVALTMEEQR